MSLLFSEKLSVATINAAILLFTRRFSQMTVKQEHYVMILKYFIRMFISALCVVQNIVIQSQLDESAITDAFKKWESSLKNWIVHPNVVGGSFFGGSKKTTKELEVSMHRPSCTTKNIHVKCGVNVS